MNGAVAGLVLLAVLVILAIIIVSKSVALIPQAEAAVIERLGRYSRTVSGQLTLLVPFIDRVRARVDLRERVVSFPPQPVITEDNLTLNIDTVVYFQVTNPQAAVYAISNYIVGVEQLKDAFGRGNTRLKHVSHRAQLSEWLGELTGVLNERLNGTQRERTAGNHQATHHGDTDVDEVAHEGHGGHDQTGNELSAKACAI